VSDFGRLRSYDRFFIPLHALVWTYIYVVVVLPSSDALPEQSESESESELHCNWRSVSLCVLVSSPRYLLLLDSYGLVLRGVGAPSLTRGRVCRVSDWVSQQSLSTDCLSTGSYCLVSVSVNTHNAPGPDAVLGVYTDRAAGRHAFLKRRRVFFFIYIYIYI
jgi:hypothetical protein